MAFIFALCAFARAVTPDQNPPLRMGVRYRLATGVVVAKNERLLARALVLYMEHDLKAMGEMWHRGEIFPAPEGMVVIPEYEVEGSDPNPLWDTVAIRLPGHEDEYFTKRAWLKAQ